jgi:hypothetical protein
MDKESKTILDILGDEEIFKAIKNDFLPHLTHKIKNFSGYSGIYIDFENFWYSILDQTDDFLSKFDFEEKENENDKLKENRKKRNESIVKNLKNCIDKNFDTLIEKINSYYKTQVRFIKAYADFSNLYAAKELKEYGINIIDHLRSKGIQTITPYVRGYKDMSDRALILGVVEDLFHENENINKIFLLTGDIDYYPLFEFISHNYKKDFYIMSFKSFLNREYYKIFFMKDKIIELDTFLFNDINFSERLDDEKKEKCFLDFVKEKNIVGPIENKRFKETIYNIGKHYYKNFDEKDIEKFNSRIKFDSLK